ncbi:MAG: DUF885 domain-containing protein [Candidatus Dormibacteria bacterium]
MAPSLRDTTPGQQFDALVAGFIEDQCRLAPENASFLGRTDYDHAVSDTSADGFQEHHDRDRHWVRTFEDVDSSELSGSQRIDRELILARLGAEVATADFQFWRRAPEQYVQDGVFNLFVHQARPQAEAVAAAVTRLAAVPQTVANATANLSADLACPEVLRRDLATVRGQAQFLREDLPGFVQDPVLRQRLGDAAAPAAAAYDNLADHVDALAEVAHGSYVFGEKNYNAVLQTGEQLSFNSHTLREMGRREWDALNTKMGDVAQRINGGSRDWQTLLRTLQKQHAADMQGMLDEYTQTTQRARQFVIDHDLATVPAGEHCDVLPAPAFERAAIAVASYFPPAPFLPGTKGTFNVPYTPDGSTPTEDAERLETNAHYEIPSTTAHEAYPGHHHHFVHMGRASPLRHFLESTYFVEGWALYAEKMMGEHGFYRSDDELLGALGARIFRAARIIVDTSLHLGEMSIDDAAQFMQVRGGLPESVAKAEALRYAAWPTQASAYLTGAIAIEEMRDRWLAEKRGTLREFHDAITGSGALPPGLAGRAVGLDPATD